jgi:hypothetical protein
MHEKLESIKPLLKAGEYEKAAVALKEYRAEFPDDWDGKLMEGLIAKLQGDEDTFRRVHNEAQNVIGKHGEESRRIKASPMWEKYLQLFYSSFHNDISIGYDDDDTDPNKETTVFDNNSTFYHEQSKKTDKNQLLLDDDEPSMDEAETTPINTNKVLDLYGAPRYCKKKFWIKDFIICLLGKK